MKLEYDFTTGETLHRVPPTGVTTMAFTPTKPNIMKCKCGKTLITASKIHETSMFCINKKCLKSVTVKGLDDYEWHDSYVKIGDVVVIDHDPTKEYYVRNMYLIGAAGAICVPFDKSQEGFCLTTSNDGLYNPLSSWKVTRRATPGEVRNLSNRRHVAYAPDGVNKMVSKVNLLKNRGR